MIQFYSAIFAQAGVELRELETEAFALERSLVGRDKTTSIVIDIGGERTNFFIMSMGLPMTHRSISLGGDAITAIIKDRLGVERDAAARIKKEFLHMPSGVATAPFHQFLDAITKEVKYSMDLFTSQSIHEKEKPEKIVLSGGSSILPFIAQHLQKQFNMKTFVGDPWARVVYQQGLKPTLDQIGPRMAVTIGLALRNMV